MIEVLLLAILLELTAIAWILLRQLTTIAGALTSNQEAASARSNIDRAKDSLAVADN